MAKVTSGVGWSDISGSVAGSIYHRSFHGYGLQARTRPPRRIGDSQRQAAAVLASVAQSWKALTDTERSTWNSISSSPSSGYSLYCSVNCRLLASGLSAIRTPGAAASLPTIELQVPTLSTMPGTWPVYVTRSAGTYSHIVLQATAPLPKGNNHHNGRPFRTITLDAPSNAGGPGSWLHDSFTGTGQLLAHTADTGQTYERYMAFDANYGSVLESGYVRAVDNTFFDYLVTDPKAPNYMVLSFKDTNTYGSIGLYANVAPPGTTYARWYVLWNSGLQPTLLFQEDDGGGHQRTLSTRVYPVAYADLELRVDISGLNWSAKFNGEEKLASTFQRATVSGWIGLKAGQLFLNSGPIQGYHGLDLVVNATTTVDVRPDYEAAWFPITASRYGQVVWWRARSIDSAGNVSPWLYVKSVLS